MRCALFIVLLVAATTAQTIKWTGLEGGWIELLNTDFSDSKAATYFKPISGQTVRLITCGSEGASISPSGPKGSLTWSMSNIPKYTDVYMKVRFGFIDSWQNEQAFVTINGANVWQKKSTIDQGNHTAHVCGRTSKTDEMTTIENVLQLNSAATSLTVVIGANLAQGVDTEFFVVSQFSVYALAGNGQSLVDNGIPSVASSPATWATVYTSKFSTDADGWLTQSGQAATRYTCGTEGPSLRQGGNGNYIQWQSATNLKAFSGIRVTIRFGFIDTWDGESAWLLINGQQVWKNSSIANAATHPTNVCGDNSRPPTTNDQFVTIVAELNVPVATTSVTVRVVSNLDQSVSDESFVVSSVLVEVLRA